MVVFYWIVGVLVIGTFTPSVFFLALYAATGEPACAQRARALWNMTGVFAMLGLNVLIWGHVLVALWRIWF
ncbi:MAG: hypothetical protein OEU93_18040 [Rubrivivax sp.]|nr:hypothetical protein [Rubrivivax sp.]